MATTQEMLDEAIAVRHAWRTGKTRESVSHNTGGVQRSITYSTEGLKQLDAYIAELRRALSGHAGRRNRIQYVAPR